MATAVGGTHPTGMHSCFRSFWRKGGNIFLQKKTNVFVKKT